jgi:hypothetical protein
VYEDDILRLRRCLGAGDSIEQGKGDTSSDSPDQFPAVHHSLLLNYGRFRSVMGKIPRPSSVVMLRFFMGIAGLSTAKTIFWKRSGLLMSLRF